MRSFFLKYLISVGLGLLLLYWALHDQDWGLLWEQLQGVELGLLSLYILLFAVAHLIRILRWGILLRALGPVPWRDILGVGAVGYMCIITFPFRLGELVRPVLVRGMAGVRASGAMATVVVERFFDGLLFVALFFIFLSLLPDSGNPMVAPLRLSAYFAGLFFFSGLLVLMAGHLKQGETVALLRKIGTPIHAGLTERAVGLMISFLDGLKVLPDRRRLLSFLLLTLIYWAALGLGMKLMAHAVHIPDMSYTGGFALLAVVVVGIMIPAAPGFAGTFELAMQAGFSLLILAPESLANVGLYTLILHVIQLLVQLFFGLFFLMSGQIRLSHVVKEALGKTNETK